MTKRTLLLAVISLVVLVDLIAEIAVGSFLVSPGFGLVTLRGQPLQVIAGVLLIAIIALELVGLDSSQAVGERLRVYRFLISIGGLGLVLWVTLAGRRKSLPIQYWVAGGCMVGIFLDGVLTATADVTSTIRCAWRDLVYCSHCLVIWTAVCAAGALIAFGSYPVQAESVRSGRDFEEWFLKQPRVPLPAPVDNPGVLIAEFIDYQCPFCRAAEVRYKSIFDGIRAGTNRKVRLVRYDFPLNSACNDTPGMHDVHKAACEAAAAMQVARAAGKEDSMAAWLWSHQSTLSEEYIGGELRSLGLSNLQTQYPAVLRTIREESRIGERLSIKGTPTFWVNGVILSGISAQSFKWAIDHELAATNAQH